jgi:hypothetical protein
MSVVVRTFTQGQISQLSDEDIKSLTREELMQINMSQLVELMPRFGLLNSDQKNAIRDAAPNRIIAEQDRALLYAREKGLEAERLQAERLQAERLQAERLQAERLQAERLQAERLRLEAERLRLEAERLEIARLENNENIINIDNIIDRDNIINNGSRKYMLYNSNQNKDKYYNSYIKYKYKYLQLKKQLKL